MLEKILYLLEKNFFNCKKKILKILFFNCHIRKFVLIVGENIVSTRASENPTILVLENRGFLQFFIHY